MTSASPEFVQGSSGEPAPKGERPTVKLLDEDGNVFVIIGKTTKALKRAGQRAQAEAYSKKAMKAGSYDEVLRLTMEYAEVE